MVAGCVLVYVIVRLACILCAFAYAAVVHVLGDMLQNS